MLKTWRSALIKQAATTARHQLASRVALSGLESRLLKQVSSGDAQRVAITRGLSALPRLLPLDEPFSAVDASIRMKPQGLLATAVQRHGVTVPMVTLRTKVLAALHLAYVL